MFGGDRVGHTVGTASTQVGAQNQRVRDERAHWVSGEGDHGHAVALEVEQVHALGAAGLLADVAKPGDGHQNIGFVCLGDGVTDHLVFAVANTTRGDDDVRFEALVLCYEAVHQLYRVVTDSDAAHLRSVFAEHGGEHGSVGVKNLALAKFLSGGASIFFNAGEDLVAAGAHEHARTSRNGQACVALGCERTKHGGGDAFTGACEDLAGDDVFAAAAHELSGLAGGEFDLFAGAAEGLG